MLFSSEGMKSSTTMSYSEATICSTVSGSKLTSIRYNQWDTSPSDGKPPGNNTDSAVDDGGGAVVGTGSAEAGADSPGKSTFCAQRSTCMPSSGLSGKGA